MFLLCMIYVCLSVSICLPLPPSSPLCLHFHYLRQVLLSFSLVYNNIPYYNTFKINCLCWEAAVSKQLYV